MGLLPPPVIRHHLGVANVNPATNDAPLDFQSPNTTKNLAGEEIPSSTDFLYEESRRERDDRKDRPHRPDVGISQGNSSMDGLQHWGMMYPMLADPALMSHVPMGFNQFGFVAAPDPLLPQVMPINIPNPTSVKDIVHCQGCTLFPPNPVAPPPTTRDRPPGCRTVFVGGLPENVTEENIREVFDRCGKISTIRMSKKNFCHIRFEDGSSVDNALFFSGYRIRIGSNSDPPNTGRLHVDYAQARDDLYEWECHNRQLQREMRHRERLEQERLRPASPPSVVHYSDHEASVLAENLKGDDTFQKAIQVLVTWLDRGDCSKRNVGQFYSMIQSSNSHMRRLMGEKTQYEEELTKAKEQLRQRMQGIFTQCKCIS